MVNLGVERTKETPEVHFNHESGVLSLKGTCITTEVKEFFEPLIEWLKDYLGSPAESTEISFQLEYCNSFSRKYVLEILKMLKDCSEKGNAVSYNWYYAEDDEEVLEEGQTYEQLIEITMNKISIEDYD